MHRRRRPLLHALAPFIAVVHSATDDSGALPTSAPGESLGCFHYNYGYQTFLSNASVVVNSTGACQAKCRADSRCSGFSFWTRNGECDLAGEGIPLVPITPAVGEAISGPPKCPPGTSPVCSTSDVPDSSFPASSVALSMKAWPHGEVPTNAQCWPRDYTGFPVPCPQQSMTVLEDFKKGWPGKCEGLTQQILSEGETCEETCKQNILCSVWQELGYTHPVQCWQGSFGHNCYNSRPGFYPSNAQRIMHGTYRVLMDLTGIQVMGLSPMFPASIYGANLSIGKARCRLYCIANLGCQYWQYSTISGCWAEDPSKSRVFYPLISSKSVSTNTGSAASAVVAGEYIQHYCGGPTTSAGVKAAELAASGTFFEKVQTDPPSPSPTSPLTSRLPTPPPSKEPTARRPGVFHPPATPAPTDSGGTSMMLNLILGFICLALCGAATGGIFMLYKNRFARQGEDEDGDEDEKPLL